jgi:hypothetical protein
VRNTNYTFYLKVTPIPDPPKINKTAEPKNKTLPIKVDKWFPIEPVISKISIFGKVEITFSIPVKMLTNLTLIDK